MVTHPITMRLIMKKIIKAGLFVLASSTSFASLSVNAAEIRIAVDGSYAPFAQVNDKGELYGFDVDIAKALCHQMKAKCKIQAQTWDGMIPGLKVGKFDAVISSMSITPERAKVVDFSERYYSNVLAFIGPKDKHIEVTDEGLKGLTIGAYRSTVSSQYLEDHYADKVSIKLYDTQDLAYLDLKADRIDLLLSDKFPAYNWLSQSASDSGKPVANQDYEFKGKDIDIDDQIAIALKKGSPLRQDFNQAIQDIHNDGTYQKINSKYFPFSIY